MNKYDVIIVGAGVAGLSAAYVLAKAGVNVVVLERGLNPGSKNVMGGVLYRQMMEELIPEFWKDAPLERPIVEQRFWLMGKDAVTSGGYKDLEWAKPPYNNFTVFRGKFDAWFASKCVEAGALIINETVAVECIVKEGKVVGVRTTRPDGDLYANVVILADGVNSLLARRLGFHKEWRPSQVALAIMEQIKLPAVTIEERFNVASGQGVTIELYGDATLGMMGTAFIYTNKEHVSIGCGTLLSALSQSKITPYDLLDRLKQHPLVEPLIKGGEAVEYYAHLIPEGGYHSVPKLVGNGVMIIGDAAQLVNGIHREGSNLAMTSGRLAAEAYLVAHRVGDFDERMLSPYAVAITESYVIKDLKKYKNATHIMETNPAYFKTYLPAVNEAVKEFLSVDGRPKRSKQWLIVKRFFGHRGWFRSLWEIIKLGRSMK